MNPNAPHPSSPIAMIRSIWTHRNLIHQLIKREISSRYRGSFLGLAWSFFNPLLMLSIYTFVFSVVFKARWGLDTEQNKAEFALVLFVGLIIHSLLAEVITRAPTQILSNINYVKKVVFPLEILSVVNIAAALFHSVLSFAVLVLALVFFSGVPSLTAILTPLTVLPIIPLLLGLGWIFSALGVYIRDIAQFIGLTVTALMFLAPIFYPVGAIPTELQTVLLLNPITLPIEETRAVLLFSTPPDWLAITFYWVVSLTICSIGFWWFQKSRKGFSDVI